MASKTTEETASEQPTLICRVAVAKLELPHGIAAKGKLVHLPEDLAKLHESTGKVRIIKYA